jgi:hypothetical protein
MAQTDQPFSAPRPAFETLPQAIRCAIDHGTTLQDINPMRLSLTYGNCGVEQVRTVWERIQSERSRQPSNSYETEGK